MTVFNCSHCNYSRKIKPELAGKNIKCPKCSKNTRHAEISDDLEILDEFEDVDDLEALDDIGSLVDGSLDANFTFEPLNLPKPLKKFKADVFTPRSNHTGIIVASVVGIALTFFVVIAIAVAISYQPKSPDQVEEVAQVQHTMWDAVMDGGSPSDVAYIEQICADYKKEWEKEYFDESKMSACGLNRIEVMSGVAKSHFKTFKAGGPPLPPCETIWLLKDSKILERKRPIEKKSFYSHWDYLVSKTGSEKAAELDDNSYLDSIINAMKADDFDGSIEDVVVYRKYGQLMKDAVQLEYKRILRRKNH